MRLLTSEIVSERTSQIKRDFEHVGMLRRLRNSKQREKIAIAKLQDQIEFEQRIVTDYEGYGLGAQEIVNRIKNNLGG